MKREHRDAFDAGYEYALDAIDGAQRGHLRSLDDVKRDVRGCMFDLVGGDEYLADHAWEGALKAFKEVKSERKS